MEGYIDLIKQIKILDAVLILFVFGFTVYGFMRGLIRMLGSLLGTLLGIWVAGHYYLPFYNWTQSLYFGQENLGKIISFIVLWGVTSKLIVWGVILLDRMFDFLGIIPFFSTMNRVAGAVFGFFTSSIFLGILIYILARYSIGFWFDKILVDSVIAKFLLQFGNFISPLLPEILRQLHSLM